MFDWLTEFCKGVFGFVSRRDQARIDRLEKHGEEKRKSDIKLYQELEAKLKEGSSGVVLLKEHNFANDFYDRAVMQLDDAQMFLKSTRSSFHDPELESLKSELLNELDEFLHAINENCRGAYQKTGLMSCVTASEQVNEFGDLSESSQETVLCLNDKARRCHNTYVKLLEVGKSRLAL
ncbi:hypothetical protein J6J34_06680 [Pseudidiomarina sp. 1ASP75-14]|uniref:hypothetical protein n=1 Tax=Pseudidiomarina terrestris TaxID=2820060 RepID=UPI00264AD9AC|nr:hypothetical protein [Pseudidiomarina sp. 1ASP75-14]MDN7137888.1 hypothetical protein [Pseudidiomarina sp. 1ASP75-14]